MKTPEQYEAEIAALHVKLDKLLDHCPEGECSTCAAIICDHHDPMHFHHDGCPSCAQAEGELNNNSVAIPIAGMTYVCPESDIVCGDLERNWCPTCPKRKFLKS